MEPEPVRARMRRRRHVRAAAAAVEENKDPFSSFTSPHRSGVDQVPSEMEAVAASHASSSSCCFFFLERAEGCRQAAQCCAAVICKQASFHRWPTGMTVLVRLPPPPQPPPGSPIIPVSAHSSAPPSRSARLLTWSVSKHRVVNA